MPLWAHHAETEVNSIDEGYSVLVSTKLTGADSPSIVLDALLKLFPGFTCGLPDEPSVFPLTKKMFLLQKE